jgi:hypothetical protein
MLMLADLVGDPRPVRHQLRAGKGRGSAARWAGPWKATPVRGVRRPSR